MAYAFVDKVAAGGSSVGVTTGTLNSTGASFAVAIASWYAGGTPDGTLTDSKSNSWNLLTKQSTSMPNSGRLFYSNLTSVGSGHTFDYSGAGIYASLCVAVFSGGHATPFDQENGHVDNSSATIQPGSVTPGEDNELVICGLAHETDGGQTKSINGGFTITNQTGYANGNYEGSALAYLIQTTATPANPTWTNGGSVAMQAVAVIATFKQAAGGGGGGGKPVHYYQQMRQYRREQHQRELLIQRASRDILFRKAA